MPSPSLLSTSVNSALGSLEPVDTATGGIPAALQIRQTATCFGLPEAVNFTTRVRQIVRPTSRPSRDLDSSGPARGGREGAIAPRPARVHSVRRRDPHRPLSSLEWRVRGERRRQRRPTDQSHLRRFRVTFDGHRRQMLPAQQQSAPPVYRRRTYAKQRRRCRHQIGRERFLEYGRRACQSAGRANGAHLQMSMDDLALADIRNQNRLAFSEQGGTCHGYEPLELNACRNGAGCDRDRPFGRRGECEQDLVGRRVNLVPYLETQLTEAKGIQSKASGCPCM